MSSTSDLNEGNQVQQDYMLIAQGEEIEFDENNQSYKTFSKEMKLDDYLPTADN